jgi:hypothetical protein
MPQTFSGGLASGLNQALSNVLAVLQYQNQLKQQQAAQQQRLLTIRASLASRGLDLQEQPNGQFAIVPSQQAQAGQQAIQPHLEAVAGLQQARNMLMNQAIVPTQGVSAADIQRRK